MGKFDGVLLVSDYDNTLVYTEQAFLAGEALAPLSAGNRQALESFVAQGGSFAIATGRALPSFLSVAQELPFNVPCVLANGAGIYDISRQQYLYTACLPETIFLHCREVLREFPAAGMEVYHPESVVHTINPNTFIHSHQQLTHAPGLLVRQVEEIPLPWMKIIFEDSTQVLEQLQRFLLTRPWIEEYELLYSGQHFLELTVKGANKGDAVTRLAGLLGIPLDRVCCIGDHNNDVSMLEGCGFPMAPKNCVPSLRQIPVIRLLPDCREDAVAAAVRLLEELLCVF